MPARRGLPLRWRATLLHVLLGLVMSLLFAGMATFLAEDYEGILVEEILRSQADDYAARLQVDPATPLPHSRRLSGYLRRNDGSGDVPRVLAGLAPGLHEVEPGGRAGVHVAVFDTAAGRVFFAIDLQDIERLERDMLWFLVAVVVVGTLLSAWLGWLLSAATIGPVRRLADAVDALPVIPQATQLHAELPEDELGRLGQAIDDYQQRLVEAAEAERSFFADASHELRTPLSVVRGAAELLVEDSVDFPALQPRLRRLDRGLRQLSELLDALLGLARRRVGERQVVHLHAWLAETLASADPLRAGRVDLAIEGGDRAMCLPMREARLVLHGVVRRLLPPAAEGRLRVCTDDGVMLEWIDAAGPGAATTPLPASAPGDRGLGVTLVGRLAQQIGWALEEDGDARRVHIAMPAAADDDIVSREA